MSCLLGFQTKYIWNPWGIPVHPVQLVLLYLSTSLDSWLAHCELHFISLFEERYKTNTILIFFFRACASWKSFNKKNKTIRAPELRSWTCTKWLVGDVSCNVYKIVQEMGRSRAIIDGSDLLTIWICIHSDPLISLKKHFVALKQSFAKSIFHCTVGFYRPINMSLGLGQWKS